MAIEADPSPRDGAGLDLLLEVKVDGEQLTEDLVAYEYRNDVLLPLGELARLLTIGISTDVARQTAAGFVLHEDQPFRLEVGTGSVMLPSGREAYPADLAQWIEGDIYVSSRLLQKWLPVDLVLDRAALRLDVRPREKLPLQARLEREAVAKKLGQRAAADRNHDAFPYVRAGYDLISLPFIDNTFDFGLQSAGGKVQVNAAYSGFMTGDLLGMEAAVHLSVSKRDSSPEARITLARHDPEAGLLGPLEARTVVLGNIGVPAVDNVMRGAGNGNGVLISNRPLSLPSSYRLQTLRGELPTGWDVTLYFNEALIGFQQSRADGLYEFEDQPLVFGRNEFKLVFNGPLGQTRVERQVFDVDQSLARPGEFSYTAAAQREDDGGVRQTLQLDLGILENVGVTLGGSFVDTEPRSSGHFYTNAGVRAAALGALVNIDHVRDIDGGELTELGLRTLLWGLSIDAAHLWIDDFDSPFFTSGKLKGLDRARVTGAIKISDELVLPVALDIMREDHVTGGDVIEVQQRLSLNLLGTSFTNMMTLRAAEGRDFFAGVLQMSRRVAGVGVSSQLAYGVRPHARLNSVAISADKTIGDASRLNFGVLYSLDPDRTLLTAGINHNFGSFGIGLSGRFGSMNSFAVGLQLFTALGRNPQSRRLVSDWRPMAGAGMVAARVFIDDNQNGRFDSGEDPVEGAGFKVNGGGRHPARSDANGMVLVNRLVPQTYADLVLDTGTLEDAMLQPATPGVRLLPRPGKAQQLDFPLIITGEIDGTVRLAEKGSLRGIGNAQVELVNEQGQVVATTRSASDGFYVISSVRAGRYKLRIAPAQKRELRLADDGEPSVVMPPEAEFINGIDFVLRRLP